MLVVAKRAVIVLLGLHKWHVVTQGCIPVCRRYDISQDRWTYRALTPTEMEDERELAEWQVW